MQQSQQRTRNRRRIDPGQPPRPIVIAVSEVGFTPPYEVRLTFEQPVRVLGLPQISSSTGDLAPTTTSVDGALLTLTYATAMDGASYITIPGFELAVRGLNGEFVEPGRYAVTIELPGELPNVIGFSALDVGAGNTLHVGFTTGMPGLTLDELAVEGANYTSFVEVDTMNYLFTYASPVSVGDRVNLGSFGPGMLSTNGRWCVPIRSLVGS